MADYKVASQRKMEPLVLNSCNAGNLTLTGPITLNSCSIANLTVTGQIQLNSCSVKNLSVKGPIALNGCNIGNLSVTGPTALNGCDIGNLSVTGPIMQNDCKIRNLTVRAVPAKTLQAAGSAARPSKHLTKEQSSGTKCLKHDNKHRNGSGAANDKKVKVKEIHYSVKGNGKPRETTRDGDARR
ncbi:unnamed protein product [Urochloa humidicola]